ncbi:MAG: hypothetical protein GY822_15075, partial [Deltaproteobacteria bacterium]|nr:hypothetical protein [Deltaproteobacteria bacterium]
MLRKEEKKFWYSAMLITITVLFGILGQNISCASAQGKSRAEHQVGRIDRPAYGPANAPWNQPGTKISSAPLFTLTAQADRKATLQHRDGTV